MHSVQEVKDIFQLLEAHFNPLELCSRLAPLLEALPGLNAELSSSAPVQTADLGLYRPALQRVAIIKMLHQLSQVFCPFQPVLGLLRHDSSIPSILAPTNTAISHTGASTLGCLCLENCASGNA